MNKNKLQKRKPILFLILLLIGLVIPSLFCYPNVSSEANNTQTRADAPSPELIVEFNPKSPFDSDPVNISIESKHGDEITWAYLSVTFIKSGISRKGNYPFIIINSTSWYCVIPGDQNQGETDVIFYITTWFEEAEVKTTDYEYRVSYQGTWESTEFDENLELTYLPTVPLSEEPVNITITSKRFDIPIKYAFLRVSVEFPGGYSAQEGGVNFTRKNSTSMYSLLPGYGGGTNVTYWVEAFDEGAKAIVSDKYNYIVSARPSPGEPQFLYIYLYDDAKRDFISGASVTISNETWKYTNKSIRGIVWSPYSLNAGEYKIEVKYEDDILVKKLNMPDKDHNFTVLNYHFNIAEAKGLIIDYEEFPQWFLYISFIILILACPAFYYSYNELQRRARQKELETKRRIRTERRALSRKPQKRSPGARSRAKPRSGASKPARQRSFTVRTLKDLWQPWMVLNKILEDERYKVTSIRLLGFFLLGIFGATWAPFYPWWMVLVIGIITAAISYRYPYLALLVLVMFIIGSTAYQFPVFGWLFMIFALIISLCSLFDWRFGFLVFLTLFVSRLGFAFLVPMLTGLLLSLFLGLAVAIASGIFLTFLVTCGDFTILSFFVGPAHDYGFITFSKPIVGDFMPTDFTDALSSLWDVNLSSMSTILHNNYTSMLPFIQIIIWTVLVYVIVYLFQQYGKENIKNSLKLAMVPAVILILTCLLSILYFGHTLALGTGLLLIGILGVMSCGVTFSFMNIELFKEFYLGKTKEMPIGTRIGEMLTLRKTGFSEIGGLKEVKRELKDTMIGPLLRPIKAKEYGVEPPRGIMLFGPPGCGKTLLMRALATELDVEMVGVRCSDVMSKWYGESEGMIEKLFKAVKERKPCILFLDEIDAIAKRRDFYSADDVTPRLLSIMLSELDGMDEAAGVIVVGATNKPELVDPALMRPGRFDKIIFIPAPNYDSRLEIFRIHLKGKPVSGQLNINHLARSTEGFSGADIENVVKEAATLAMKRSIKTRRSTTLTNSDFLKILPRIKPSLSREMKQEYEKLQEDFERKKYGKEIKLPPTERSVIGKRPGKQRAPGAPGRLIRGAKRGIRRYESVGEESGMRRARKKETPKWKDIVGLDNSKRFFKSTIENNLQGDK